MKIVNTLPETTQSFVTLMQDEAGVFGHTTRVFQDKIQVQINDTWVEADFGEASVLGYVVNSEEKTDA